MNIGSLVASLGGTSDVARALAVSPSVVSNWRSRGKIPAERWAEIVALARAAGMNEITLEALASLHARPAAEPAEARS